MDKWEKVVQLHRLMVSSKYVVPLKTILAELECSEATFHRIRSFLQNQLGAPLVCDHKYHGYKYENNADERFELPGLWFSQNEIEILLAFQHAVDSMQQGFFYDVFAPVQNRLNPLLTAQKTTQNELLTRIKIIPLQSRPVDEKVFKLVADAVMQSKRLLVKHAKIGSNLPTIRIISPHMLVRYRDNWYVDAYCHLRNELRTFALNRFLEASREQGAFFRVAKKEHDAFFSDAYGIFTGKADKIAVVLFTNAAAQEVCHETWHPKQNGKWVDNTTYELSIPYSNSRELVMDILRWGSDAEVTKPEMLRQEMKTILSRMHEKYSV